MDPFAGIGKPAQRALAGAGYRRLEDVAKATEANLLELHGMGPKAISQLTAILAEHGLALAASRSQPTSTAARAGPRVAEPAADRPVMPGYGIAASAEGLLPWSWAVQRLTDSHHYWLATRTPAGAPHLAAVWAVWFDGAVCFSTGQQSRKGRNLATDPRCSISPENARESVVLEGVAELVTAKAFVTAARKVYARKYGMGFPASEPVFAIRPVTVFGVIDGEPEFTTRATRWRFGPARS